MKLVECFLLFSFASFKGLFDLGTSSAFFTFLSKEKQSVRFINIFFVMGIHSVHCFSFISHFLDSSKLFQFNLGK